MKGFIAILLGLGCWFLASHWVGVSPLYLPNPIDVLYAVRESLLYGVVATVQRTSLGYCAGIVVAYLVLFATSRYGASSVLDAQFSASRAIPAIAMMPLFILWFGFGEFGRVLLVALSSFLYFLAPLQSAYSNLPRPWGLLRYQLNSTYFVYYFRVIVPGTALELLGAFRITFAMAFSIAIASDYLGSPQGIGKFVETARVTFNVAGLFVAILTASAIGVFFDKLIVMLFNRIIHWRGRVTKG